MTAKKILIIENEAITLYSISVISKTKNMKWTLQEKEKMHLQSQWLYYNLILLDIGLPDIKGIEFLENIKSSSRDTIIVMLTEDPCHDSTIDSVNQGFRLT
jgi:DNA-binding response OmpR family regulator